MRIYELSQYIRGFSPVLISIDGQVVWTDDIDITNMSEEEGYAAVRENKKKYLNILARHDLIKTIKFTTVYEHHSLVDIYTEREG